MLAEYDENGSLTTYYTRGEELVSQEKNGAKSYYLHDGFNSVRMLTNESGSATDFYTYDAFGNLPIRSVIPRTATSTVVSSSTALRACTISARDI